MNYWVLVLLHLLKIFMMSRTKNDNNGTVYPFLDARTPMADSDLLPVKLSVFLKGAQFRVGIKVYSTKEIFEKATSLKGSMPREAKVLKAQIDVHLEKAKWIIEDCPNNNTFLSMFVFVLLRPEEYNPCYPSFHFSIIRFAQDANAL